MESKGKLILLLVAGIVVAFAAIAVYNRIAAPEVKPIAEAPKISNRVVVAKRDIAPGTFVQAQTDLTWLELKPDDIKDQHLREGNVRLEDYNGAVLRKSMRAGEPVLSTGITRAGEGGFMSAVLEPGMRAVTIAVNSTSGNAGFVSPGDRVDLVVTRKIRTDKEDQAVSETFIHDVRVVAIDQMLDNPENKAVLAKTVTVEVTPRQVEQIAVAGELGKISLALRSIAAAPEAAPSDSAAPESGEAAVKDAEPEPMPALIDDAYRHMRVIRGTETETIEVR